LVGWPRVELLGFFGDAGLGFRDEPKPLITQDELLIVEGQLDGGLTAAAHFFEKRRGHKGHSACIIAIGVVNRGFLRLAGVCLLLGGRGWLGLDRGLSSGGGILGIADGSDIGRRVPAGHRLAEGFLFVSNLFGAENTNTNQTEPSAEPR